MKEELTEEEKAAMDSLNYEETRDELERVVSALQTGGLSLEESVHAWEKGEYLAKRAEKMLEGVKEKIEKVQKDQQAAGQAAGTQLNLGR
ncbi:MAG: exodeoxyribonuclease VII small subunit [Aeriscardovia sp.]|nr:exodeoxyribonuclease VII small subunit [Aeriscardovia sp.]MBQ1347842.1 exodeoxyribonuclease VII small subunit [Aeriscardovia sp.]MBQ1374310.1 exodeoxyribonuclease VII small subunit [Aeriscardovia sp.]MBQ5500575.1 exodeoxyribonuclease VII small subunit [Aeriscardovia sp.]